MRHTCALIGLGAIGMGYDTKLDPANYIFTHARALAAHPSFVLSGAADISPEKRREFEQTYGIPAFAEVSHLLDATRPELVVIASPTDTHAHVLDEVLNRASPRLILCEKPLSRSVAEAREMVRLCSERGIPLFVNYPRRSDPGPLEIVRRIHSGEIARPVKGVAWYSKGIFNNGSHIINLLEMWLGPCLKARRTPAGYFSSTGHDPEPDGTLTFEGGAIVLLAAKEEHYSHHEIELVSPSGRLRYQRGGELVTWEAAKPDPLFPLSRMLSECAELIPNGRAIYQRHIADGLAAVLDGKTASLCTGHQALQTLECIQSLLDSRP